jgi:hypothetical protein
MTIRTAGFALKVSSYDEVNFENGEREACPRSRNDICRGHDPQIVVIVRKDEGSKLNCNSTHTR